MNNVAKINNFTDLHTWQEGHKLVLSVYNILKSYPKYELFALSAQMRRCAISVTSNLAEGFSRKSKKEKIQFYSISKGSLTELQNQLLISRDVGYINIIEFNKLAEQTKVVSKLLTGLMRSTNK